MLDVLWRVSHHDWAEILFIQMDGNPVSLLQARLGMQQALDTEKDLYPQYRLRTFVSTERMFLSQFHGGTPEYIKAFTIANKADDAIDKGDIAEAEKMAYHALRIDPTCIDAWRIFTRLMNQYSDGDTIICALREILAIAREIFNEEFEETGMFYKISSTRPYMRLLCEIGNSAQQGDKCDTAIYAFEEMIRLNHSDNMGMRENLLAMYLKMIGRKLRGDETIPIRTIEQAEELINAKLPAADFYPLWGEDPDDVIIRWARIMIAYARKEDWKEMAKREYNRSQWAFKLVFNEIESVPPSDSQLPLNQFNMRNDQDMTRKVEEEITIMIVDWPDFVIQLHDMFRKPDKGFNKKIREKTPNFRYDISRENKSQVSTIMNLFLEKGRQELTAKHFQQATEIFSMCKRSCIEQALPSHRWYINAPFAIASNRATCSAFLGRWDFCRIDTRYTLLMKPDHVRSYERLPKIAQAFYADQLANIFSDMIKEIKSNQETSPGEWKQYANKAIGLLSLSAIVYSRQGRLDEERIEVFMRIGIEDAYTSVNVPIDLHPILPWLTENDFESV